MKLNSRSLIAYLRIPNFTVVLSRPMDIPPRTSLVSKKLTHDIMPKWRGSTPKTS